MTIIQIIDAFTFYGLDVIALATLTCVAVQIFKKTLLKRLNRKIITFLPFVVGCILYAAYAALRNMSLGYLVTNYVSVLEHGFSVGALSTVVYVFFEQFVRGEGETDATQDVIKTLIEGYVPDEGLKRIAAEIAQAIAKDVTGDGAKRTAEILSANCTEDVTEKDVELLARLIIETLAHICTT